jgi:hypothetical protein
MLVKDEPGQLMSAMITGATATMILRALVLELFGSVMDAFRALRLARR